MPRGVIVFHAEGRIHGRRACWSGYKGTNVSSVPSDVIDRTMQFLNETTRQILGFRTANEVHYAKSLATPQRPT
jgi:hypothetical protein